MFSRARTVIGKVLVAVGFIFAIGLAGTDDVNMMQGIHEPIIPLAVKVLISLAVMGLGAVLMGGGAEDDSTL